MRYLLTLCLIFLPQQGGPTVPGRTGAVGGGGGSTLSFVTYKDSTPGTNGSVASVTAPASGSFSLTSGDLIVCFTKGNIGVPTISMTDVAGNSWTRQSNAIAGANFSSEVWYSITTLGSASETITYHSSLNSYLELQCQVSHRTSGTWTLDVGPATYHSATSTSIASATYSTTAATEILFFWAGSYGGVTFSAQSIGGQSPTGTNYIGTNASTSDAFLSYYIASATQTSTTATATNSASDPYDAYVLSFK